LAAAVLVLAATIVLWGGQAYAMPAEQGDSAGISYSGQLAGANGAPVADGNYTLRFALYAEAVEGDALWAEEIGSVAVQGGYFTVTLGNSVALDPALVNDKNWLAIWVRGPGESDFTALAPRVPFEVVNEAVTTAEVNALSCDHTHFGENWSSSDTSYGLRLANSSTGDGLRVYSSPTTYDYAAVYGVVIGTGAGSGIYGRSTNGHGIYGASTSQAAIYGRSISSAGVFGISVNDDGVAGSAAAANKSGVYGQHTGGGFGVYGRSASGYGMGIAGAGDSSSTDGKGDLLLDGVRGEVYARDWLNLYGTRDINFFLDSNNNDINACFTVWNGGIAPVGTFCENGTKSAILQTEDFGVRKVYAMESPEVWLEEFGTATLVNGVATVAIDPLFAQMISQSEPYHVFITPLGESGTLFVAEKGPGGFTVKEASGGLSNVAFDWRIAAKRVGLEGIRAEVVNTAEVLGE
jgi:hypothetical protein